MISSLVVGLGAGDEAKGLVTDYLAHSWFSTKALNIRFSGGHQAGHTVVSGDFRRVFSNFGSGTFRGLPTYWSKYCTVEPVGLMVEYELLKSKGLKPVIYIDAKCPVTTPNDIGSNRETEEVNKHGSCGVGVGQTFQREEDHYSLTFMDLFYPEILKKRIRLIAHYYMTKKRDTYSLTAFYESCEKIARCDDIKLVHEMPEYSSTIYEGSQGLLLDQNFGFFPNVTRSNTGSKNAVAIQGSSDFHIYLVTRAYQTRHGNGFMSKEDIKHNILTDPLETNQTGKYQGEFRRAILDVSMLEYAINKDDVIRNAGSRTLVVTCLDHLSEYCLYYKGCFLRCNNESDFITFISSTLGIDNVLISRSNDSKNIEEFNSS